MNNPLPDQVLTDTLGWHRAILDELRDHSAEHHAEMISAADKLDAAIDTAQEGLKAYARGEGITANTAPVDVPAVIATARLHLQIAATYTDMGGFRETASTLDGVSATVAELIKACQTFSEWLDREERGGKEQPWFGKRDTPEGETLWREWYDENLRLCGLSQERARAALVRCGVKP
jgi:hypothetical protein